MDIVKIIIQALALFGINMLKEEVKVIINNTKIVDEITEYIFKNKDDLSYLEIENYIKVKYNITVTDGEMQTLLLDKATAKWELTKKLTGNSLEHIPERAVNLGIEMAVNANVQK